MIVSFVIDGFVVTCHEAMSDIAASDWDACGTADHPFVQHRHLRILEDCGLAVPEAGFQPHHVILRRADGTAVGAAPVYLKTSSLGEMGVDLGLPLAHLRAVGPYYPKLQVEVPMVPSPGPRLLVRPGTDENRVRAALIDSLRELARRCGAASVQISYMTAEDQAATAAADFQSSQGTVFVWSNRGEASFEDFVASMTKNGRTRVRKERLQAAALGLRFDRLQGERIAVDLAPRMFAFYKATYERYGSTPLLNLAYFEAMFRDMPDVVDLLIACRDGSWQAVLMGVVGGQCFHAQHWGLAESQDGLLFEMYYREMEHALDRGLEAIDFGHAGHHKTLRGIGVEVTRHALWFRDKGFETVVAAACAGRRAAAAQECEAQRQKLPFRDKR